MGEAIVALLTAPFVIFLIVLIVGAVIADWWISRQQRIDYMKPWRNRAERRSE